MWHVNLITRWYLVNSPIILFICHLLMPLMTYLPYVLFTTSFSRDLWKISHALGLVLGYEQIAE